MHMNYLSKHHTASLCPQIPVPMLDAHKKAACKSIYKVYRPLGMGLQQVYNQPRGFISPKPSAATNIAPNVVMPTMFAAATSLPPMAFTIT